MDAILQKCPEINLAAKASFKFDNLVVNRVIPVNPVAKEMLKCLGHDWESKILPGISDSLKRPTSRDSVPPENFRSAKLLLKNT